MNTSQKSKFKQKKTGIQNLETSKGNIKVTVPLSSQRADSEPMEDFNSEINEISKQNQLIIDQLGEEGDPQNQMYKSFSNKNREKIPSPKKVAQSYNVGQKQNFSNQLLLQDKTEKIDPLYKPQIYFEEENQPKNEEEKQEPKKEEEKFEKELESEEDNQANSISKRKIEEVKNDPGQIKNLYNVFVNRTQIKYTEDSQTNLLIISLKKLINEYHGENQLLRRMNLEYDKKELEYQETLRQLSAQIEEMELEQKLLNDQPSDHVKFDLSDLDNRLINMESSLQKATTNNAQEKFIQDIIEKNKVFVQRSDDNSSKMRKLKTDLAQLKTNLINLNNQ